MGENTADKHLSTFTVHKKLVHLKNLVFSIQTDTSKLIKHKMQTASAVFTVITA